MSTAEIALRAAGVLCWFTAFGFGLPNLPAIWSLRSGCGVPLLFGFPAYGGGTFERFGITTTIPLLGAFLLICVLEGVAGWLLWEGRQIAPIAALVRTALILLSWTSLG